MREFRQSGIDELPPALDRIGRVVFVNLVIAALIFGVLRCIPSIA